MSQLIEVREYDCQIQSGTRKHAAERQPPAAAARQREWQSLRRFVPSEGVRKQMGHGSILIEHGFDAHYEVLCFTTGLHGTIGLCGGDSSMLTYLPLVIYSSLRKSIPTTTWITAQSLAAFFAHGYLSEDWDDRLAMAREVAVLLIDRLDLLSVTAQVQRQFTDILASRLKSGLPTLLTWADPAPHDPDAEAMAWVEPWFRPVLEQDAHIVTMCSLG